MCPDFTDDSDQGVLAGLAGYRAISGSTIIQISVTEQKPTIWGLIDPEDWDRSTPFNTQYFLRRMLHDGLKIER